MARRETAARRYAEAAFEIGTTDGTLDAWETDLVTIRAALENPTLRTLAEHPAVAYPEKERILRKVLTDVRPAPMNLALLMVRRGRPAAIGPMVDHFTELLRRHRGVSLAEVRTALPLDDEQRTAVSGRLAEITGGTVEINEVVDESLIGGIAVRIGDVLYDASVRSRLERLRARLTAA